ncbi:MAG: hypothetical protein K2X47_02050, partial [Bdellovibrionales bacterium]|nr:hypothetical protein [Bdellovibrionales bacterium]
QGERTFEAYKKFLDVVEDFPKLSLPHFNLGTTFDKSEESAKAEAEYLTAIALETDPVSVFGANFNLAIHKTKEKKVNEALERYQAALKIMPDSKEVKTNIELLFKPNEGGGGGEGDQNSDKDQKGDKKDQKSKDGQGKEPPPDAPRENRRKMPKPFKSEDLSKQDMERILEELKRQENQIRGRMHQDQKSEEKPVEKDW